MNHADSLFYLHFKFLVVQFIEYVTYGNTLGELSLYSRNDLVRIYRY